MQGKQITIAICILFLKFASAQTVDIPFKLIKMCFINLFCFPLKVTTKVFFDISIGGESVGVCMFTYQNMGNN